MSVFDVLLPVLLSVQVHATTAMFARGDPALTATFTFRVIAAVPLTPIGVVLLAQVTSCPADEQANPPPEPLTNVSPAGMASVTVMVPEVAADPPFVAR